MIRFAGFHDKDWLQSQLEQHYPDRLDEVESVPGFLDNTFDNPNYCWIRGDNSAVMCKMYKKFLQIGPFWGDIWEVLRLFRTGIEWGKSRGAKILSFASTTGYNVAPIAKRLGITSTYVTYVKEDI